MTASFVLKVDKKVGNLKLYLVLVLSGLKLREEKETNVIRRFFFNAKTATKIHGG
jgi:hypothetical protein